MNADLEVEESLKHDPANNPELPLLEPGRVPNLENRKLDTGSGSTTSMKPRKPYPAQETYSMGSKRVGNASLQRVIRAFDLPETALQHNNDVKEIEAGVRIHGLTPSVKDILKIQAYFTSNTSI